jgi:hypothetical protein
VDLQFISKWLRQLGVYFKILKLLAPFLKVQKGYNFIIAHQFDCRGSLLNYSLMIKMNLYDVNFAIPYIGKVMGLAIIKDLLWLNN